MGRNPNVRFCRRDSRKSRSRHLPFEQHPSTRRVHGQCRSSTSIANLWSTRHPSTRTRETRWCCGFRISPPAPAKSLCPPPSAQPAASQSRHTGSRTGHPIVSSNGSSIHHEETISSRWTTAHGHGFPKKSLYR